MTHAKPNPKPCCNCGAPRHGRHRRCLACHRAQVREWAEPGQRRHRERNAHRPGESRADANDAFGPFALRSQAEVAILLGVSRQSIQQAERHALWKMRRSRPALAALREWMLTPDRHSEPIASDLAARHRLELAEWEELLAQLSAEPDCLAEAAELLAEIDQCRRAMERL